MAKILKERAEKETKPTPAATSAVQPSGSRTLVHQMEHDPMNSYNKADWKDCKLTTTWIKYLDWKGKIDTNFKYLERTYYTARKESHKITGCYGHSLDKVH